MKALVQRVRAASVTVGGETIAAVGPGLCVLLGVARSDTPTDATRLAGRVAALRVFENDDGRFDRSVRDVGGEVLVVSQFTLVADTRKGNRPSFTEAARPEEAGPLYERFCTALAAAGAAVATGRFGARMVVEIQNDGPVTVIVET